MGDLLAEQSSAAKGRWDQIFDEVGVIATRKERGVSSSHALPGTPNSVPNALCLERSLPGAQSPGRIPVARAVCLSLPRQVTRLLRAVFRRLRSALGGDL